MKPLWITIAILGLLAFVGGVLLLFLASHDVEQPGSASVRWWVSTRVVVPGFVAALIGFFGYAKSVERKVDEEVEEKKDTLQGFKRMK